MISTTWIQDYGDPPFQPNAMCIKALSSIYSALIHGEQMSLLNLGHILICLPELVTLNVRRP